MLMRALLLLYLTAAAPAEDRIGDAWNDERNPIRQLFKGQRLDLWSLQPVQSPPLPGVGNTAWPRHEMDHFIFAALAKAGLTPAPEVGKRELARRLYFDLTGLPPSPEQVEAFCRDAAPDASGRLADALLASREFGEHWARWWLDAVRYSDSNGYDWDEFRPQAWRFRDYIVRSLNADKPLDRLIQEHLAGDEMVSGPPQDATQQDCLIATGYLRIGPWDNSSKLFNEEHKTRAAWMADLTETTASAFMGLTMSCCRCHDHKTEPFAQTDHYRFRAFFEDLKFADEMPLDLAADQKVIEAHNASVEARAGRHDEAARAILTAAKKKYRDKKDDELRKLLGSAQRKTLKTAEKEAANVRKERRKFTAGMLATSGESSGKSRVLSGGDADTPKEEVEAGIPAIFNPGALAISRSVAGHGRRSALAGWIVSGHNPLTARVMVNRIWQQCFGRGIVTTPGDFGFSGVRPSHSELLDHVATLLVRDSWSLKKTIRRMVTSSAYQQAAYISEESRRTRAESIDSANTLLWRMNPRRLTAEQLRDAMLSVAGTLRSSEGGPPRWPALPDEVLAANPAFYDDNETKTKGWYPDKPEDLTVRSLYLIQKRTVRVPFMETFDLPDNFVSCTRRGISTVPSQAVTLLNNPFSIQCARDFAARVEKTAGSDPAARVTAAWQLALNRNPTPQEMETGQKLTAAASLAVLCRAVLNLNEFIYLD